jgi:hypothetical protein
MYSPFAHLSFWYAALAASPQDQPAAYPFLPPGGEAADRMARHLAQQLRDGAPDVQKPLLRVLREKASLLPWSAIHPSWLQETLGASSPQWRLWALEILPETLRAALSELRPDGAAPALLDARPPAWWAAWFTAHVKATLAYPDLPPWEKSGRPDGLPGVLWEDDEREIVRLLAVHGTRGFVSAVRRLPRPEAQQWLWQLPAQCQPVANEAVQARKWSDDPFWPEIFQVLAPEFPDVEARLFRAGLADFLRAGLQQGQELPLRRLAFRLPRRWGEWALRTIAERPAWLEMPLLPDVDAWKRALHDISAAAPTAEGARA